MGVGEVWNDAGSLGADAGILGQDLLRDARGTWARGWRTLELQKTPEPQPPVLGYGGGAWRSGWLGTGAAGVVRGLGPFPAVSGL